MAADIPVTGQTITASGTDILFNNTLASSGGVVPNASGVFTLKAGTTYRLYSSLYGNFSNATSGTLYWDWVDATTNTKLVGATTGLLSPLTYTAGSGSLQPVSEAIYTPLTNQTIKVRVVVLIGNVGLSAGSGYCRAIINQLNACSSAGGGSSVTASNGLTAASNDVKLGGNLSAATTLTNNGNALNIAGSASTTTFASNGNVGIGTAIPDTDAILDITSFNKGLKLPSVSLTAINNPSPLSSHVAGIVIYNNATVGTVPNNVIPGLYINDGTKWNHLETPAQSVPAGSVFYRASNTIPNGYLECDGSAVSRATYSTLFSVIGTTYGIGDGSTTFNLPDLRGEFIRGWDNTRGIDSGRAIGAWQKGSFIAGGAGPNTDGTT